MSAMVFGRMEWAELVQVHVRVTDLPFAKLVCEKNVSMFGQLLQETGLFEKLSEDRRDATVFVFTNLAYEHFLEDRCHGSGNKTMTLREKTELMSYHIAKTGVAYEDTRSGEPLQLDTDQGSVVQVTTETKVSALGEPAQRLVVHDVTRHSANIRTAVERTPGEEKKVKIFIIESVLVPTSVCMVEPPAHRPTKF